MPARGNTQLNSPEQIKAAGPYLHLCQFGNYSSVPTSLRPEFDQIRCLLRVNLYNLNIDALVICGL